jgi:metabolite-proton symporter
MVGAVAEWYEFFLYGSATALVFGAQFFRQTGNATDGIIAAFALYGVGFLARPIGGLVFGHFGDKYGRKTLLQVSLTIVGLTTFLMGCLPTYDQIGMWAPVLLVALRLFQGFGFGGEWGGATLIVSEHAPANRRGLWSAWPQSGVPLGNILATLVLLLLSSTLTESDFLSWGWRVAFWLSAVVVAVGYYIRAKVDDAPIFKEAQEKAARDKKSQLGIVEVLKHHKKHVAIGIGARFAENILYYLAITFSLTYLKTAVHMDTSRILLLMLGAHVLHFFLFPLMGLASDKFGRRPVFLIGCVLTAAWGFIGFPLMNTGTDVGVLTAVVLAMAINSMVTSPYASMMTEMFPTRIRYTALSLCYQFAPIVAGGFAPLIALALLQQFDSYVPVALYLVAAAAITFVSILFVRETRGVDLREVDRRLDSHS